MQHISIDSVKKLAKLSALSITDEDARVLTDELATILTYVKQLSEVDTTGVVPTYQVTGLETVTRPDTVVDYGVSRDDLLKNAPDQIDGSIKVPRVRA